MNRIPLDPHAAAQALAATLARIAELRAVAPNGAAAYAPPAYLAQPARPVAAWQVSERTRKGEPVEAVIYHFDLHTPFRVGNYAIAGYLLIAQDGGGRVVPVYGEMDVAAKQAAAEIGRW